MRFNGLIIRLILFASPWLVLAWPSFAQAQQVGTLQYDAAIVDIQGDVLVNEGQKYVPAREGMKVKNGTRVMVMKDSQAKIRYQTSCVMEVTSFEIHDVDDRKCAALLAEQVKLHVAPAAQASLGLNPGVIGSIVGLGIVLLDDEKDRPVSP